MKRKCFVLSVIAILLAVLTFGAYAYFTAVGTAENVITTGNIQIKLHQTEIDRTAPIRWGTTVDNTVTVENTGKHPAFVRIALEFAVENTKLPQGCVQLDVNTAEWEYDEGFYYYNAALQPGETTQPLFTQVYFDGTGIDPADLDGNLAMHIDAYGVQSENNGENPQQATGWPQPIRR